jgi:hypothetical protein
MRGGFVKEKSQPQQDHNLGGEGLGKNNGHKYNELLMMK